MMRSDDTNEHVILTAYGVHATRTVRRLEEARRHVKSVLAAVCGVPWNRMTKMPQAQSAPLPVPGPVTATAATGEVLEAESLRRWKDLYLCHRHRHRLAVLELFHLSDRQLAVV